MPSATPFELDAQTTEVSGADSQAKNKPKGKAKKPVAAVVIDSDIEEISSPMLQGWS